MPYGYVRIKWRCDGAIATGKTQGHQDHMAVQFAKHDGWLRECGVNYRNDPDLAGWLINARE